MSGLLDDFLQLFTGWLVDDGGDDDDDGHGQFTVSSMMNSHQSIVVRHGQSGEGYKRHHLIRRAFASELRIYCRQLAFSTNAINDGHFLLLPTINHQHEP